MDGQELSCGSDDSTTNTSRLACDDILATIPEFNYVDYDCESMNECKDRLRIAMQDFWQEYNITFVTERPGAGPYEMAMIGGPGYGGGILGVAPLDCDNAVANSVSFSFSEATAFGGCPLDILVATASQELAHAFGLCHNTAQDSFMYPASSACEVDWSCGDQIDSCGCEGGDYDAFCPSSYVMDLLGPAIVDAAGPLVEIISPQTGASVPANFTVHVAANDSQGVREVEVFADGVSVGVRGARSESGYYEWTPSAQAWASGERTLCAIARDIWGTDGPPDCVRVVVGEVECTAGQTCCGPDCCEPVEGCETLASAGEPCNEASDCRTSRCLVEPEQQIGYCTENCTPDDSCVSDDECLPGFSCEPAQGAYSCVRFAEEGAIGWPCTVGDECASGLCAKAGFCSQACDSDAPCPATYACEQLGEIRGCVRQCAGPESAVSGGCGLSGRPTGGVNSLLVLLVLLGISRKLWDTSCAILSRRT